MNKFKFLSDKLEDLEKKYQFITPKVIQSPTSSEIKIKGKKYINFASNNYLGLAGNKRIIAEGIKAMKKFGVSAAAVRTIAGTTVLHQKLERKLAQFKKVDDVILLQSGFTANLAVLPTIANENDIIFSDELNHASIIDACRLSKATTLRYKHCNPNDLEDQLVKVIQKNKEGTVFIVSDGVFSMDGDLAPLPDLCKISEKYNAILIIDDAHGEGVLGRGGRGIVDHFSLHSKVDVEVGTLSKAFGVVGGFVGGRKEIISYLRQRARPYLFSSSLSIPDTACAIESIKLVSRGGLQKKLWENTEFFKNSLKSLNFDIGNSQTPIVPLIIGDEAMAKNFADLLFQEGIFAVAITYPTVALGKARIRFIVTSAHSKSQLKYAVATISLIGKKIGVI